MELIFWHAVLSRIAPNIHMISRFALNTCHKNVLRMLLSGAQVPVASRDEDPRVFWRGVAVILLTAADYWFECG